MTQVAESSRVALKNILVATDYSPVSSRAIGFAGGLASRFDATLYAVHAEEPINYAIPPQFWKAGRDASRVSSEQVAGMLRKCFPTVRSEMLQEDGPICEVINHAVAEKSIDLLVLGTHGRTGVPKFLLGSAAEEILRRARCPVLTIGPRAKSWDEVSLERAEILYATDFSPEAYEAAPHAFAWAEELNARLTLLHVMVDGATLNLGRPLEPAEAFLHLLERLLPPDAERRFPFQVHVERGVAAERILAAAERLGAALIVTGAREPAGFPGAAEHLSGATLHKVIARSPCAVLSVH